MKKAIKRTAILCLLFAMILSLASPVLAESGKANALNWMSEIGDDQTLAQFTIPGTHDSCTQNCVLGKCQFVGVGSQLKMGVRFLDIRLKEEHGKLNCYHSFINCFVSFQDVMKEVRSFLEAHPSECVVMSIKDEGDESAAFESVLVEKWIDKESDLWFTEDRIPTLGEARGKIVLMRRYRTYHDDLTRGINARNGWADDTTFEIKREGYSLTIQDDYCYDSIGLAFGWAKWQNFAALDRAIPINDPENLPDFLHLNFASGCNAVSCGQLSCATVVNAKLRDRFEDATGNHGIVIMDYVDACLVNTVTMTNFR